MQKDDLFVGTDWQRGQKFWELLHRIDKAAGCLRHFLGTDTALAVDLWGRQHAFERQVVDMVHQALQTLALHGMLGVCIDVLQR